jgi:hypothetical protein
MNKTMLKSAAVTAMALAAAFAAADIQVTVDGTPVKFESAQPQMIGGRVLVPLRGIFEQMGVSVDWNSQNQTIFASSSDRHVKLQIGSYDATVEGHVTSMDVQPQIIDDSTMVPLRFIAQALGAKVDWQPDNEIVAITTRPERPQRLEPAPPQPAPPPVIATPPPTIIIERPAPPAPVIVTPPPPPAPEMFMLHRDMVIPMVLDRRIASNESKDGEHFTLSIQNGYGELPAGTVVEGEVRSAKSAGEDHSGSLDLRFTEIRFPDGHHYPIFGFVTPLNNRDIVQSQSGRYFLKANGEQYEPTGVDEHGGAWLVANKQKGIIVGGSSLGGTFGAIVGAFDHSLAKNVIINGGTQFALVLRHDLPVERHDLRDFH